MKKNHFRYIFAILFTLVLLIGNITIPIYATGEAPVLTSPDAVVIDGTSGQILFEQNAHVTSYPASITKLMTALLALESLKAEDEITFSYDAIHSLDVNASQIGIQEGEVLSFDQAMYGMMLMSANEIANGIAERVSGSMDAFVEKMNLMELPKESAVQWMHLLKK